MKILKLQKNHLNKKIPNNLLKLKKLNELNLSNNDLEKQIPNNTPLNDFPQNTYSKNKNLYKKPLPPYKI